MTSPRQNELSKELIAKAEQGKWNLGCDEKLLGSMQSVAKKIEGRSEATKASIDKMMLNCDETGVKLKNLTRINSLQNKNYCENKIRDDDTDEPDEVPKKEPVKLPQKIAIDNGLKMLQNCFEKHQVNLDPSSGDSKTATVFRPIDKYSRQLPHLIGTQEWKEKWHVGLLDTDAGSQKSAPVQQDQPSNVPSSLPLDIDERMSTRSSFMASQDSLSKSSSSIGDQMIINQPVGLFDDIEPSSSGTSNAAPSSFFRPQVEQRKIVNLFDDEPPSLNPSPLAGRRTVNMFDDYGSVDSFPSQTSETLEKPPALQQPVDLFNDSEFDNFIKKIEQQEPVVKVPVQAEPKKPEEKPNKSMPVDMKKLSDEIKNFQLKKADKDVKVPAPKKAEPVAKNAEAIIKPYDPVRQVVSKPKEERSLPKPEPEQKKIVVKEKPRIKKVTNLFDDDDDDYFDEIMKQKSASKPSEQTISKAAPPKTKLAKLFDDDDDNAFEDIFKKKSTVKVPEAGEPSKVGKKVTSLFGDDEASTPVQTKTDTMKKKTKNLFDDGDDESETFEKKLEVPKQVEKSNVTKKQEIVDSVKNKSELMSKEEKVGVEKFSEVKEAVKAKISDPNRDIVQDLPQVELKKKNSIPKDEEKEPKKDPVIDTESPKILSTTLPFLSDIPPDDDEAGWGTDDHFEDSEPVVTKTHSFPTVPIFDDFPPDDDFVPPKVPVLDFIESDDEPEPTVVVPKKVLPIPEPEVKAKPKVIESKDEPDRSAVAGDKIKSKLDMLAKKSESKAAEPLVAKKTPGKLNMNLKINVGALMPGARLPPKASVEEKPKEDPVIDSSPVQSPDSPKPVQSPASPKVIDPNNNSNLLNNELSKSRSRIFDNVKRKPSTRLGRLENYRKSLNLNAADDMLDTNKDDENKSPTSTPNSLDELPKKPISIFEELKARKELRVETKSSTSVVEKNITNVIFFDEEPPPAEPAPKAVQTNKISVFYDDEDDTRLLVEQRKKEEQQKLVQAEVSSKSIETRSVESKTSIQTTSSMFDDDSDDDLFGKIKNLKIDKPAAKIVHTAKQSEIPNPSSSLFDDTSDDDLFKSKGAVKKMQPTAKKLFESDDDEPSSSTKPKAGQPKKQSLFGDDESDDDLFSSKPKSSFTKSASSISKSSSFAKQATKVVDDPLKDLLNN